MTFTRATLDKLIPATELAAAIDAGHVTRKTHPELPLSILTYTRVCQYENLWNPVTMTCRGLIVDDKTGEIVALPFPKIFVTGMHGQGHEFAPPLPAEPFEIFEKADGSLIIVFHYAGRWHAASKGSFTSEQAEWAQRRIDRAKHHLDPDLTYLAEAIYPENRILVDYGNFQRLLLLAAYRPADGTEEPLSTVYPHWSPIGGCVHSWGLGTDISHLEKLAAESTTIDGKVVGGIDEEGYVIRFASGLRAKIKLSSYLKLHALFTGTNERTVWEVLASGQDPAVLFDQVPDEFAAWVRRISVRLQTEHARLIRDAYSAYDDIVDVKLGAHDFTRKEFALEAAKSPCKSALFMVLDGNEGKLNDWAWKQIRPRGDQPFKTDEES